MVPKSRRQLGHCRRGSSNDITRLIREREENRFCARPEGEGVCETLCVRGRVFVSEPGRERERGEGGKEGRIEGERETKTDKDKIREGERQRQ